jgi:hypothetical protein
MNPQLVAIGELLFAVGAWFLAKQLRKDLNGLGQRVVADRSVDDFRFWTNSVMQIVMTETKEDRKWLAERILEAGRRKL